MKALNIFQTTILIILFTLFLATPAFAQYGQYGGQYGVGGGPAVKSIFIEKSVGKPSTQTKGGITNLEFVHNLSASDPRFAPDQEVNFKLRIKNTSSVKLIQVQAKDFLPNFIEPLQGPGNFDSNTRIIAFDIGDLNPDEEKTVFIRAKILSQDKLPADKGLFCLVNKAVASAENVSDEDTAQFCIEKEVAAVNIPTAGPEAGLMLISLELVALGAGIALKKII